MAQLRKRVAWQFFGQATYSASWWIVVAILAKLTSPDMVGRFTFATSLLAPIFAFANSQLQAIIASDVDFRFSFRSALFFRSLTSTGAIIVAAAFSFTAKDPYISALVLVMGILRACESYSDICYGVLQRNARNYLIAASMTARGLSSALLICIAVAAGGSLFLGVGASAVAALVILLSLDLRNAFSLVRQNPATASRETDFSLETQLGIAKVALPMALVLLINTVSVNAPRYSLQMFEGPTSVGYFSAIFYVSVVLNLATSALCSVVLPNFAAHLRTNVDMFLKLLRTGIVYLLSLSAVFIAGAILFGREILALLYTPAYGAFHIEFVLVMVSVSISAISSLLGTAITASQSYWPQFYGSLVFVAASAVFSLAGAYSYGVLGASVGYCLSWMVKLGVNVVILRQRLKRFPRANTTTEA